LLIYAHRGASAELPENTFSAFERALDLRVDGIELDIQSSRDRVPVVLHDLDLLNTVGLDKRVADLTAAELSEIDAGDGRPLPLLREVMGMVGARVHVNVEVKVAGIEAEILGVLTDFPNARWSISSFDWDVLRTIRRLDSAADLWVLTVFGDQAAFSVAEEVGVSALSLYWLSYTDGTANALRDRGLKTMIWTVNGMREAERVYKRGADALCTDDPGRMQQVFRSR
jgi:glycerophosphoryl diester phosphodiesterase